MSKTNKIQKKKKDSLNPVQRKEEAPSKSMAPPPFALNSSSSPEKEESASTSGGGNKLPEPVKEKMNAALGMDFSDVNIHANSGKAESVGALAYAQGKDVHFAGGQYNPNSQKGQELLAHELAHVKQQSEGKVAAKSEVGGMPLNEDKHLEKEADDAAAKLNSSNTSDSATQQKADASGGATQLKKADGGSGKAPVQRFKMREKDIARYPKFARFVQTEMGKNVNDPRLLHFMKIFGENVGENSRDIKKDLQWGEGPEVRPYSLPTNKVSFKSNGDSEVIRLSRTDIEKYESNDTFQQDFLKLVLESNMLNGYTQFLDDQDGQDFWGKEGNLLEKAQFGQNIETTWDARDSRRCKFGQGEWEVSVVKAGGPHAQRIKLFNAGQGNGQYIAKAGMKIPVKSRAMNDWSMRTEFNPAGPDDKHNWKRSQTITNKVGKDCYMVRGEYTGDKDRQDLQMMVRKKGSKSA